MTVEVYKKICFIITAIFVSTLLCFFFLYLPKTKELKKIKQEIDYIKKQSSLLLNNISPVSSELNPQEIAISKKYDEIIEKLSDNESVVSILSPIRKISADKNIKLISLIPRNYELFEKNSPKNEPQLEKIIVDIILEGYFIDIGQYLFDLSNMTFFGEYENIKMEKFNEIYPKIRTNISCTFLFFQS